MISVLKFFGGLLAIFALAAGIIYFIYPGVLLSAVHSLAASGANLEKRSVQIDDYTAHYYGSAELSSRISSAKPVLVMLHGLGDDKNSFVTSVRELSQDYRVILPDLQAHGENALVKGRDYSIAGQAAFIDQLLAEIGVNKLTIGGNSMGGHTAAAYAARYPSKVNGLIVLNATGMQLNSESVYVRYPSTVDAAFFNEVFSSMFVTPPAFPAPVIQHLVNELNPKIPFMNDLISRVETGQDFRLNEKMAGLTTPSLVLWGQHDPIVPIAYAEAYHAALSSSRLVVLENAGHSPQFEIPERIQNELKAFLLEIKN